VRSRGTCDTEGKGTHGSKIGQGRFSVIDREIENPPNMNVQYLNMETR
jgi:hypothetical protein